MGTGERISEAEGQALVTLARQTIAQRLGLPVSPAEEAALGPQLKAPSLQQRCGTFVTLKIHGELRGCIGSLVGTDTIVEGVRENAINAAFCDPRFSPLSASELDAVAVEVSVLTEPQPLEYRDAADLLAKLRPGVDGLIIRQGLAGATFLPQVWEQLPDPQQFLAHLCLKAGLAMDAWQHGTLTVLTYQVQYFEEGHRG
ncbi:MAG: AmmeMemoRadiSam system protein A [Thermodesulfobacteriota bacterium]